MNFARRTLPLAALALMTMLSCDACRSKTKQAANQQAQQPSTMGQQSSTTAQEAANEPQANPGGQQAYRAASQMPAAAPQAPPPPAVVVLPAGTRIRVTLDQDLGSKISRPGDSFTATVTNPILVNGHTVVPSGARADGMVINARPLGRFKGGALLQIRLERVHTRWGSYPVATSSIDRVEKGKGKRSLLLTGGGAGLGALIGGLVGGGKGALIGGLAGGGAGAAGSAFTGNREIFLPAGTYLTFHLYNSVHITE